MNKPFAITLFAPEGDPQGIRHVDKSNWSGFGVVFTKALFGQLKHEPGYDRPGLYILVGNAAEETLYIGEADPLGERLKNHVAKKEGWAWGVYFFDTNHKIGKTEVQYLEAELVARAKQCNRAILTNKNVPTSPSMSPVSRAAAMAFLEDMLLILPMLGINAFSPQPQDDGGACIPSPTGAQETEAFDTLVVPAREEGFQQVFLGQHCWYAVRLNARHIPKLKYIAAYQVSPVAAITHIAEIEQVEPFENTGKYLLRFKAPAVPVGPIARREGSTVNMQSTRYALREKLLAAKDLDGVWAG